MQVATIAVIATIVITLVSKMTDLSSSTGALISQWGLDPGTAAQIVALFVTGGAYAISVLYPFLLPFVGTIQFLLITAGTGAVVGY